MVAGVRALLQTLRDPELRGLAVLVATLLLTGTVFYHLAEDWRLLDSLYFSVTSLLTVGFGDFVPSTDVSKVFTILYTLVGVGILVTFVSSVASRAERLRDRRLGDRQRT